MTVWCHTTKSESETEPGFVISTPDYILDPIFSPFGALFFSKKTLMTPTMTIAVICEISRPPYLVRSGLLSVFHKKNH